MFGEARSIISPGPGVPGSCVIRVLGLNSGPLKEHQVLSTSEPNFHSFVHVDICILGISTVSFHMIFEMSFLLFVPLPLVLYYLFIPLSILPLPV